MSEGYWKGTIVPGAEEAVPAPAPPSADMDAPDGRAPFSDSSGYWRGDHQTQGPPTPVEPSGSVSMRARRIYAAEALRQKDHVAAGLLAIFLGMFGVHKFYLGCNQAGFVMMAVSIIGGILTLGLAAAVIEIIALIEGVIYLTKSQTAFDQAYVLNQRDWF